MKRRILSVLMAISLLVLVMAPAAAEANSKEMRHCVVCVEVGLEGSGGYWGMGSGTGFFVGEENVNPQFMLTNWHVVSDFIDWGSGELQNVTFQSFALAILQSAGIDPQTVTEDIVNIIWGYWQQFMGNVNQGQLRSKIRIYYDNNDFEEGYLVDSDSIRDMALLRLAEPTSKRSPMAVTIPSEDMVTKTVCSVGYPGIADNIFFESVHQRGEKDSTVNTGTVSRLLVQAGTGVATIQTDAEISHGNSGGPLVFENGAAIGITAWGVSDTANMEKVYYALSMAEIKPMLERNNVKFTLKEWPEAKPFPVAIVVAVAAVAAAAVAAGVVLTRGKNKKKPEAPVQPNPPVRPVSQPRSAARPEDSGYRIQGVSGALEGRRFMVRNDSPVVLGRNASVCGVAFPEDTKGVSGRHCAVWFEQGEVWLKDLGSTHGTFLEPGQRLAAEQSVRLQVGQRFWLGSEQESLVLAKK